ncbi:hypothetical protein UG55_100856 [Frankia sp. EI5c]|uniref:CATRA system-associated protein n=1 Tax=Frankia sp. EI5c TaxID=683316 RepID=UPI0007C2BA16|nr:CATRA system-associated protein [Frankia sp. EI5c]OAA27405.1 hypothetical protein UG55_100856 [Frankia sp. EI5c]
MAVDEETRREACDVLRDALDWTTTAQRWAQIDEVVVRIRAAFTAGHDGDLLTATADLEILDPRRANDASKESGTPPPERIHDRLNDTIHTLGKKK